MSTDNNIYLINLESAGNQKYIFATNKLRNIVGASELLYRVGTRYVERAVKETVGRDFDVAKINDEKPIEGTQGDAIEVVIATSGKALLLARGRDTAINFIQNWSRTVALEAPGLQALAVCSEHMVDVGEKLSEGDDKENSFTSVMTETARQMSMLRMRGNSPQVRFQRLPIVAECVYSGLPAVGVDDDRNPISASSLAQREAADAKDEIFCQRMRNIFLDKAWDEAYLQGLANLEKKDWLAVIHADGNGLGQLFIDFHKWVVNLKGPDATGRDYIRYYRGFSSELDQISCNTFKETCREIWGNCKLEIAPIVLGGDDLTVVVDGYRSIEFAKKFMVNFCENTQKEQIIKEILDCTDSPKLPRLGMCAGISIAKPHFPFSQSYKMAEELMSNAKKVKEQYGKDSISLDFHILYDSVAGSISDIRKEFMISEKRDGKQIKRILTAKPFVVSEGTTKKPNEEWKIIHRYDSFEKAREALKPEVKKEGKTSPALPSSQAHDVREALFSQAVGTQEKEWQYLLSTYKGFGAEWKKAMADAQEDAEHNSLYIKLPKDDSGAERYCTYFLDALEAMKFLADEKGKEAAKQ